MSEQGRQGNPIVNTVHTCTTDDQNSSSEEQINRTSNCKSMNDYDSGLDPNHNMSKDLNNGRMKWRNRKKGDNNHDELSRVQQQQYQKNNYKNYRSNSILHTYPIHQMATSEFSKTLIKKLKEIYKNDVLPIEQKFNLYKFCLPTNEEIQDSEFDAKPMVLMLGQYSTGKTTFIRHLIGRDFPAMHIGPEPTTDRFTALIHGSDDGNDEEEEGEEEEEEAEEKVFDDEDVENENSSSIGIGNDNQFIDGELRTDGQCKSNGKLLKGNSVTVVPELPFSTLASFGSGFLSHFVGSICSAPLLQHVTLIDTPGVLSGEKQRLSRSYDFSNVTKWFADRSDLILLLFDGHKLDISDELKDVIQTIRPNNDDKMRCILNKADSVTREQLVRVYGSLMWSMGKIFESPEVVRVYTGSYWERPLVHDDFKNMFESDESLLLNELINLPKSCAERKLNEVVKRIRIIKVHLCLFTYLKRKTPRWFGRKAAMENLMNSLDNVFDEVRIHYKLSAGDFPDLDEFRHCLEDVEDFSNLVSADEETLQKLDKLIAKDIPAIMRGATGSSSPSSKKPKSRKNAPSRSINSNHGNDFANSTPVKKQKFSHSTDQEDGENECYT